jgi:ParB/RepB/Spo0J family partition protein
MSDKVKLVKITDIIIGDRFRENLGDLEGLCESIKDKGVLQPITLTADMSLMAGGRRVAAAMMAGLTKIPALLRDQSGEDDAEIDLREVELIENVFRKDFDWVEQVKLIAEIDRMMKAKNQEWSGRQTSKLLGHSQPMTVSRALKMAEDLQVLPELAKCKSQDEATKLVKKAEEQIINKELIRRQETIKDSGMRDILTLARSNYQITDALVAMAALPDGAGNVDLIEVDPPYGIDLNEQKKNGGEKTTTYQEVTREDYPQFLTTVAEETYRIASRNCWMIFWFGPTHQQLVLETLRGAGWIVDEIPCIWNKSFGQTISVEHYLARSYEPFFLCRKGAPTLVKHGRSNVFTFTPLAATKKYHPTERPVELIEELIQTFVGISGHVFSPFLGSGATLRACYNTCCTCWGYDLNPEYKDRFLLAVQEDTEKLNKEE